MNTLKVYCYLNDDARADLALDILLSDDVSDSDVEFMRHVWTGNYLQQGNPFFHHPALSPYSGAVMMFIEEHYAEFMSKSDLETYSNLPDEITVYRGGSPRGCSWSLSYDVAKTSGDVFTATLYSRDVLAYINDREEQEIITLWPIKGVAA